MALWRAWSVLVAGDAAVFCVAGVALGDIQCHLAWQAWRLWHSAGSCDALGPINASTRLPIPTQGLWLHCCVWLSPCLTFISVIESGSWVLKPTGWLAPVLLQIGPGWSWNKQMLIGRYLCRCCHSTGWSSYAGVLLLHVIVLSFQCSCDIVMFLVFRCHDVLSCKTWGSWCACPFFMPFLAHGRHMSMLHFCLQRVQQQISRNRRFKHWFGSFDTLCEEVAGLHTSFVCVWCHLLPIAHVFAVSPVPSRPTYYRLSPCWPGVRDDAALCAWGQRSYDSEYERVRQQGQWASVPCWAHADCWQAWSNVQYAKATSSARLSIHTACCSRMYLTSHSRPSAQISRVLFCVSDDACCANSGPYHVLLRASVPSRPTYCCLSPRWPGVQDDAALCACGHARFSAEYDSKGNGLTRLVWHTSRH